MHNLLRYFRNSVSVIYFSKLLSTSSSTPNIVHIYTQLKSNGRMTGRQVYTTSRLNICKTTRLNKCRCIHVPYLRHG